MSKIDHADMFKRLNKQFPRITHIVREKSTNSLLIYTNIPPYLTEDKGEFKKRHIFKIECIKPKEKVEPYTEETLEKALREFPILFNDEISRIKQSPGFISFSTYNAPCTKDELIKDFDQIFNYTSLNIGNDPLNNIAKIKTSKKAPLLPKMSKQKKDKLF